MAIVSCIFCIEISALRRVSEADWTDSVRSSPASSMRMASFSTALPSCTLMAETVPEEGAVRVRSA